MTRWYEAGAGMGEGLGPKAARKPQPTRKAMKTKKQITSVHDLPNTSRFPSG